MIWWGYVHAQVVSSQHIYSTGFASLKKDDDDEEDYGDIDDDNDHTFIINNWYGDDMVILATLHFAHTLDLDH